MKECVNGKIKDMSPEAEADFLARKQAFEAAMAGTHDDTARITKLETRLSRYEANEQATNILLGVTE